MTEDSFEPHRLIGRAVAETGIDDVAVGGDDFLECFSSFCRALDGEARLSEMGRIGTEMYVLRILVNRLRFHRDLRDHPEILDEEIAPPIVVVGLPRTGTTKLQRILSEDPNMQRLDTWRLLNPAPFPGPVNGEDPRIGFARESVEQLRAFPEFYAAHPTDACWPDEDAILFEYTFDSYIHAFRYHIPSHRQRVMSRPDNSPYQYERRLLQYLQWQDGGGRGRPWVLKTPIHVGHLSTLLEVFPGATVVHCHRDPRAVMASFARLIELFQSLTSDDVDIDMVRRHNLEYLSRELERNLADREAGCEGRVIDVMFEDIRDDIASVLRRIYHKAGLEIGSDLARTFTAWERDPGHHTHGHKYSSDYAGLTDAEIEKAFAGYLSRFFPTTI